jgi:DNA-binding NarL/FixJ family response regulator
MNENHIILEMLRDGAQHEAERRRRGIANTPPPAPGPADSLFTIHTGSKWMELEANQPDPKMLFGSFWWQQELCILFADTNLGKSILAVQLGHEIARGAGISPFANNTGRETNVLYIDFELSPKQFNTRYRDRHATHNFAPAFYRAGFNPWAQMPAQYRNFNEYMNAAIESAIKRTRAQVLIIDNISCLRTGANERANEALSLMRRLKALKQQYGLSILVLAHTPKRNPANFLTADDLHGSKMLINFADSAFAIGQSGAVPGLRYLKQIKQRSGGQDYGAENVCIFSLQKQYGYLCFHFEGYATEQQHLRRHNRQQRLQLRQKAIALQSEGLSQRQIAAQLHLSAATINRLLNWK